MDPRNPKRAMRSTRGRVQHQPQPQPVYRGRGQYASQPVYRLQTPPLTARRQSIDSQPGYHPRMAPDSPNIYYSTGPEAAEMGNVDIDPFWVLRDPQATADAEEDEEFAGLDAVPETQDDWEDEAGEEDVEVEVRPTGGKKKLDRKPWTQEEEEALAKCWIKVSVDKVVGDRQTKVGFWKRVLKHFQGLVQGTLRTKDQLNSKWNAMNPLIQSFNGYHQAATRMKQSGCNEINIRNKANDDFERQHKKTFTHNLAWNIVKDNPKWKEQPYIGGGNESSSSNLKRKSVESTPPSGSNATPTPPSMGEEMEFNVPLPCLNEDPAPSRQSKGKKKATSEESSRCSVRDTLSSYTTEKASILKERAEVQKKKDDEYFKFLQEEEYNRDMKFVMDPHEHINDPAFREFIITRKRELCAKHGWPCTL